MNGLPDGWAETTLGDVVTLRREKVAPAESPDAPFLGLEDVESHTSRVIKYGRAGDLKSAAARFSPGEVLYSRLRPYLNKVVLAETEGLASAEFLVLRPTEAIASDFIRRRIMADDFLAFTASLDRGDRPRVNYQQIANFHVDLPPLAEQSRILAKLNTLTGATTRARTELSRIPALTARYKQAVLSAAFTGELTRQWREENLVEKWLSRKVSSLLKEIVAGKNLRCEERPPRKDERGVLKVSAVSWGEFDPQAAKTLPVTFDPPERTRVRPGDLLISRANTLELVGAVVLVKETPSNLFLSDKVLRLELDEEHKRWLLWFLRSPGGRGQIEKAATGNQLSMRNLSQAALSDISMPWPTSTERNLIVLRIETAFAWLDRMAAEHEKASHLLPQLDQVVLAKAFRGELVPQDPNDEPASILLERLRAVRVDAPKHNRRVSVHGVGKIKTGGTGSPTVSEKEEDMKKTRTDVPADHLCEIVKKSGGQINAEALWRASEMEIDEFYKLLRDDISASRLKEGKDKVSIIHAR